MLRTIGNYLNSGQNSIGQQHGFTMSSLCKFAETKGNSKLSVLDFAMTQLNKFEKMGLELPEETECLSSVLGKGPNYLEKLYVVFEREAREFQSFHFLCVFQLCHSNYNNNTHIAHS